jgi:hypothetical protein
MAVCADNVEGRPLPLFLYIYKKNMYNLQGFKPKSKERYIKVGYIKIFEVLSLIRGLAYSATACGSLTKKLFQSEKKAKHCRK